jgi:2-keto-4-pentenoate hydratase/2-oxohepta-3-ene-1,7-dioic acid hydratase in catechol pathway
MRLLTFRPAQEDQDGARLGAVRDGRIVDLVRTSGMGQSVGQGEGQAPPTRNIPDPILFDMLTDMLALIAGGPATLQRVAALASSAPAEMTYDLDAVEVLAPIPRPRKNVFCLGRNYAEHAAESLRAKGQEVRLPTSPNIFTKAVTSVIGPYADIRYDASLTEQLDWEVELGVVIGPHAHGGRNIPQAEALEHVWGYTVINDVSARDIQNRPGAQWFLGKSLDGSCPMGPLIVTADEIADPQALDLRLSVNGVMKQEDTTAHMLFDVATTIAYLSRVLTLEPGDIIATGTPAGVGFARTPPEFLRPGDVMQSTIAQIGTLRNRVVDVSGQHPQ